MMMKGKITVCENLSTSHISEETFVSRLHEEFSKPNSEKTSQAFFLTYVHKWQRRTRQGRQQYSHSEKCTRKPWAAPLHTHKDGQSKLKAPSAPGGDAEKGVTHTPLV